MEHEPAEPAESHSPRALDVVAIVPIVLVVAWVVRSYELYPWVSMRVSLVIAVAGAALIGLPALFWALDHGYRGLGTLTLLGALVGAMPLAIIAASGALGLIVRAGPERAWELVWRGAPIPGMGAMPWITFARAELPAAATGAISAAVYWAILVALRGRRRQRTG